MHFNAVIPEFAVTNCAASLRFYCDVLGFEVAYERPEEGFAFITFGEAQLMIDQIDKGRNFEIEDAPLEYPYGRGLNVQIRVDAVVPLVDALAAAGIKLHLSLEEKWYRKGDVELGNRQFVVMDPDGYLLRFFEDLGERPRTGN
ncbi:MAG: bleomycin resistance protein [Burkholderiales bacterium]